MELLLIPYIIADIIFKSFICGWPILVPLLLIIMFLMIKKRKQKKDVNCDIIKTNRTSIIIDILITIVFFMIVTNRLWGPYLYKCMLSLSMINKEIEIEKKLEEKYNKNFTFISKSELNITEYNALGASPRCSTIYKFIDDDDVVAIVDYGKNFGYDYYESKRSKYEIEQIIYDYARQINFNSKFYVFVSSPYESITSSSLESKVSDNFVKDFIIDERNNGDITFILTSSSEENKKMIVSALKPIFGSNSYFSVYEYVVDELEYQKAVDYYESDEIKNGIENEDYVLYHFDENNGYYSSYYIK